MHKALHSIDDIERRHVTRNEGGRELDTIEDCLDASTQRLDNSIKKNKER